MGKNGNFVKLHYERYFLGLHSFNKKKSIIIIKKRLMNKRLIGMVSGATLAVTLLVSAAINEEPITRSNDTVVVNTTEISKGVRGFKGATPVQIYIKKDKVVKVETLPNRETPKFLAKAKTVLKQFEGKDIKTASLMEVDGVSGATYTSKALVKNVQQGLEYYKNKK